MNWVLRKAAGKVILALLFSLPLIVLSLICFWATFGP